MSQSEALDSAIEDFVHTQGDEVDVLMLDSLQHMVKMADMKASGFFEGDEEKKAMYTYMYVHCKNNELKINLELAKQRVKQEKIRKIEFQEAV